MINYIETEAPDGTPIRVEIEPMPKGVGFGKKPTAADDKSDTEQAYEKTLSTIRICATDIINTIQALPTPPQTAAVNFGIKIDGDAGAMIAKNTEMAHFKVSLSWKQGEDKKES